MGTFLHPVGPLPAGAYWLRRAMALLLVALVGFGGWLAFGGSDAAPAAEKSASSSPPTTSQSPATTVKPTPKPSIKPTPSVSVVPVVPVACVSSTIRVVATTDATLYTSGRRPLLQVKVTNNGSVACTRNLGQSAVGLTITAGGVRIWSSEDCAPGGPNGPQLLAPGQTITKSVSWTRLTSKPGCPAGLPSATPGAYDVVARNETTSSAAVRFVLR